MERVFEVWAPAAERVSLSLEDESFEMERDLTPRRTDGWWRVLAKAEEGDRYGFSLDGGNPLPDPRSCSQPDGVHERSVVYDHSRFAWHDHAWQAPPLGSGLLYELHVGTFTDEGTFDAAIERLGYLRELGVTHVELMPVNEFPGERGWGYDGVGLYAVHRSYGGPDGLKRFVDACHRSGLAVLLDVVYNHFGPSGNYLRSFGPYFTERHSTPWGEAVNLDGEHSDEVRRFFCDNALMWMKDFHLDGLRLDAVHALFDMSAVHFLEQLAEETKRLSLALRRSLVLIAESDLNDPRVIGAKEAGGFGIDAQWNDDFHHAVHALLTGERSGYYEDYGMVEQLARALEQGYVLDGRRSVFRKRRHGKKKPRHIQADRFVTFVQNHDQVGNRAQGERLSQLVDPPRLKLAAAVLLTAPSVPMLFQGEEWGASTPFLYFTDHREKALAKAIREGRQHEFAAFGWNASDIPDPQQEATFLASKLKWDERGLEPHVDVYRWYQTLIALRRTVADLSTCSFEDCAISFSEEDKTLTMSRGDVHCFFNFSAQRRLIPFHSDRDGCDYHASVEGWECTDSAIVLPPYGVVISCRTAARVDETPGL